MKKSLGLLFLLFIPVACGLPKIGNIPIPSVLAGSDNKSFSVFLPSSYMSSVENFQGVSFFYKIYPDDSNFYANWSIYSSFLDAYNRDYERITQSFSAESTLGSFGYFPFNRDEREQSPLPIFRVSRADQGRDFVLTLDFRDVVFSSNFSSSAWIRLTENGVPVPGYPDFRLLRRAVNENLSEYKPLGHLVYYRLSSQKMDVDLEHLPNSFLEGINEKFNIILYGVVYAGDVFNPIRSQAFRLGHAGLLISGSNQ